MLPAIGVLYPVKLIPFWLFAGKIVVDRHSVVRRTQGYSIPAVRCAVVAPHRGVIPPNQANPIYTV